MKPINLKPTKFIIMGTDRFLYKVIRSEAIIDRSNSIIVTFLKIQLITQN